MRGTQQSRRSGKLYGLHGFVLLVIVCGLLVHLGGRYTADQGHVFTTSLIAISGQFDAKHQHLDSDSVQWLPPQAEFSLFLVSICGVSERPIADAPFAVHLDDSLYNRPPPARQGGIRSFERISA
jgi:hypothetical protein